MKYIKTFENHSAYEKSESGLLLPNVSLCKQENDVHYNPYAPPIIDGHEYVDLGLSVKWAKMNIGATGETDYGQYFQWGDVSGYTSSQVGTGSGQKAFSWADYKYSNNGGWGDIDMTKYNNTDHLTTLNTSDDAAVVNMGDSWRMPTEAEFNELLTASTITKAWTTISGINGYKFSLAADPTKYVFFPAAGYCNSGSMYNAGNGGCYWSSSLNTSGVTRGLRLSFYSGGCSVNGFERRYGCAVRGVVG